MIPFVEYIAIVAILLLAATIFVLAYAIVVSEIRTLLNLISGKRKSRKFWKTVERCRDDFA